MNPLYDQIFNQQYVNPTYLQNLQLQHHAEQQAEIAKAVKALHDYCEAARKMAKSPYHSHRIQEALDVGCGYDAPGSFAAWLSTKVPMHAYRMPGGRHDIGDMKSYEAVRDSYRGPEK